LRQTFETYKSLISGPSGHTRDEAISNAERHAIEVIADRIAHGVLSSSLGVSFTIPDEQLARQ
jgi:hypothetical protein